MACYSIVSRGQSIAISLASILLAATLLVAIPQTARAMTHTVCPGVGVCSFESPEDAVNSETIIDGDIIDILTGTYVLSATLQVSNSITILGNDSVFDANGIRRAIDVTGAATNFSLSDVTIRNGLADAESGGGGALRVSGGATVTITGGIFENNQGDSGGAVHNISSTVNIIDSVFIGNRATAGNGGAILTDSGGITNLTRTSIDGNQASVAGGGLAVAGPESQLNLIASTVSGNGAAQTVSNLAINLNSSHCGSVQGVVDPGPMGQTFIADATVMTAFEFKIRLFGPFGDLNVIPNDINIIGQVRADGPLGAIIATGSAFAPGGVWPGSSTQTLTFILDQAASLTIGATYAIEIFFTGGYGVFNSPDNVYLGGKLFGCTGLLSDSSDFFFRTFGDSTGLGGGIHASAAGLAGLSNSTVSGNLGDGAMAASDSSVSTFFSTITNNSGNGLTAKSGGDAIDGNVFITASIIAGNGGNDCNGSNFTSGGFNLIGDNNNCTFTPAAGDLIGDGEVLIDPLLGPLQDNGGLTETHAIGADSPARDAGGAALSPPCTVIVAEDQRGVARPDGPACDIGAYEFVPVLVPLQTLIDAAEPSEIIDVPDGTYAESITIGDGKTLRGSGPGSVVIDATGLGVSAITATGDFTLENIRVTGGSSPVDGGGIFTDTDGTDITLLNVVFDNNDADLSGGAIYVLNGTLTATNVTFTNNSAGRNGGAITALFSNMAVFNGTFNTNTAGDLSSAIAGNGGAIILSGGTGAISASFFTGNQAFSGDGVAGRGGAIFNDGNLSITDTTIDGSDVPNIEEPNAGIGGGIYNNAFSEVGGTLVTLVITGSTLSDNIANDDGGAIGGAGVIQIRNSTLSGNTAASGNGGGIGLTGGTANLNNVTLAFNTAPLGQRGALFAEPGALISLSNSLLSGNSDSGAFDIICDTVNSLGYNLSQGAGCLNAPTDITAPPLINSLADNGGPTETHSLNALSPALNKGHPVPNFTQFDETNSSLLQTQGSATVNSGVLALATNPLDVGSAFLKNPIDPTTDFSAKFEFQILPGVGGGAADGFTFTISGDSPTVLGRNGGFLGIADRTNIDANGVPTDDVFLIFGAVNGVSVEFDTFDNDSQLGDNDPDLQDHIGIDIDGNLNSVALKNMGPHGTLSDGRVWTAWIDYNAADSLLEVRASNFGGRPDLADVFATVDLVDLTGSDAYVGFTGVTGTAGIDGEPRILSFSFASSCESSDQRGDPRPKGSACDIGAFEGEVVPLELGPVVLSTLTLDQGGLSDGTSYPGVVDVPIIDIPIEKLTGDTFNAPESAPLGSFPLGSFPLGSFDLRSSPLGSFPLGSFPIGSFPIGSFPLGSFPLSSIPLLSEGGWSEILNDIPELAGAPLQAVTLEQLLTLNPLPDSVASIALRDLSIQGSPLASFSLPSLSLGDTTVDELDQWALNDDPGAADICTTLTAEDPAFTDCGIDDTLMGLEVKGAPVSALSLSSLPLGSFPIGSFPLGSFPIGSFPLGSFPLGSFPLGSFPIGSFPIGSFPLGSFPLGSFNLLAAPIGSFPLGSFPLGSFPLGSFEIDGRSFCTFYDEVALAETASSCADLLGTDHDTDSLADLLAALQAEDSASGLASTPLGSFPLGSFDIANLPLGSFSTAALAEAPLSLLTLGAVDVDGSDGCVLIDALSDDSCGLLGLTDSSTLANVATAYGGSLATSPLGSFPIGSFGIANLPIGSFQLIDFDVNGTPLGSFPLGSFDLISSPLGSFLLISLPPGFLTGPCIDCLTLADAARAGVLDSGATLTQLQTAAPSQLGALTWGDILNGMTLAMLYGPGVNTLGEIENTGNLTLGQLLIAMMLKTDFPWETIPLAQLDAQEFSADHFIAYAVDIPLAGTESELISVAVTLADSFLYVDGSALLNVTPSRLNPSTPIDDPAIVDNGDGTQTLTFNLILGGFTTNTIMFEAVPALALGDYTAMAAVTLGAGAPVLADDISATVSIIPYPGTDISDPDLALTAPVDVLLLGFINTPDDNDFYLVAPPAAGDRVAVFMSNPAGDNDLIMYEPLSTVEAKGQTNEAPALDSVPFEDDGVDYEGNLTEEPNALEDVNLAAAPLASISTNRGDADESVSAVAGNTEPFTIQVSGYNGAISDQPYTLRVKVTPQVPSPICTARSWLGGAPSTVVPAGDWMPDTNAVFLVNGARLAASDPDGSIGADDALAAINDLINAPGITDGVVVDVSTIFGVDYTGWDTNPCDVDAANAIVNAITAYLEVQRELSPDLAYVTIVGSDEVIPFARKPDETSIANESTFAGEFADNAMFGALVTRHFLSDDTYGDIDPIPWLDRFLNVPELGVGRLLESAADIQAAAENYIAFGGVLDPQTALSAGYDFIADAAQDIDDTFNTFSPALGFSVEAALIDQPDVDPLSAWTRSDFLSATGLNSPHPTELVSFNMHFDFDEALPSSGDAAGNYTDNLINTADLGSTDLAGGIWFTVGCHSGTSVADVSVVGGAPSDDWAQAFSRLGATYLAQNAYGLGDTEAVALTERLMANFARNLNGSLTIGQANALAKQQYFADLGLYGEYDYKALQAATLFGLPMYQYGNGAMVVVPPSPILPVTSDPLSGLMSASWSLSDTGISATMTDSKGELFSVDGEVQFVHFRPLQPIVRRDVTGPGGEIASGAFLTALTTEDIAVDDIAFARPVIDLGDIEPEIETDEVVFPTAFTNIANFKAPPPGGGPFAPRQQLNVIVGQFTSPLDGATNGTERLFRSFDAQVFYRPALAALAATAAGADDFLRPEFDNVQASVVGQSGGAQQAAFSVDVFDEGTVLRVAVLYLQSVTGPPALGNWVLVDLVKGAGNTWTGGGPVDLSGIADGQIDYMVQAVDNNGNVANSTFKGLFYVAEEIPPAPAPGAGPGSIGVAVTAGGEAVNPDDWITADPVSVQITDQAPGISYEFSVDFAPFVPLTPGGFQITEDGVHIVTVQESDGKNPVTFVVLIDTKPPQVKITTPADGEFVVQTQEPAADFDCLDAGSGITTCVGSVPGVGTATDGAPLPMAPTGSHSLKVEAQDDAQLGPEMAEHAYYVVEPLEVNGPMDPTATNSPVEITASTTDLQDFIEKATIDWGDGTLEKVNLSGNSVNTMGGSHSYLTPDVYQIKVTVNYHDPSTDDLEFVHVGVLDFVVVYDPAGGFVTGGGWFDSPPDAYTPNDRDDTNVTGKAHFGLVSRYKKGQSAPDGSTNFRFAAGDLEFNATAYDWMIITGARARYKGKGSVNGGAELYKFQVTALDADENDNDSHTEDSFRIKIWQEDTGGAEIVLYDNGLGTDDSAGSGGTTPLGGGSITVHQAKKK